MSSESTPPEVARPEPSRATGLADGEWHRLHPATPALKGGLALVAIIGFAVYNLRDAFIGTLFGRAAEQDDPVSWLLGHTAFWIIALAVLGFLLLLVGAFYLSWRMHTFRITDEVVEVRSGIVFRTHRKGRLDRIQGINIVRPFIPRLFGAAKLEVNVAGQDANVQLEYLGSAATDALRREILRLASGTQAAAPAAAAGPAGSIVEQRMHELLAPELDPDEAPVESVVTMHLGRVVGSLALSEFTIIAVLAVIGVTITTIATGEPAVLFGVIPGIIGGASYYWSKFTRSLRYTIAGTPDGIRIGYGLLSTSNDTLPPGRIHSVQVSQPLLWRIPGWWEVKVNRATKTTSTSDATGQRGTTILPVGHRGDVMKVLALVLPNLSGEEAQALLVTGLESKGGDDGFTNSPRRAAGIRWFSWRRNGFAVVDDAVLLRKGAIWRELVVVPLARMQSVSLHDGPIYRRLRLGAVRVHTVAGPITPALGALDREDAASFFDTIAAAAVRSGTTDTTHHWRAHETPA